jgi:hypothetical protein
MRRLLMLSAPSPSVHEIVARELERFVIRQNIRRYTDLVAKATDPVTSAILKELLLEERAKLEFFSDDPDLRDRPS